jgi:hypothetical protein
MPGSGHCLRSHYLATGLHPTIVTVVISLGLTIISSRTTEFFLSRFPLSLSLRSTTLDSPTEISNPPLRVESALVRTCILSTLLHSNSASVSSAMMGWTLLLLLGHITLVPNGNNAITALPTASEGDQ